jgi:hypothetical protein
MAVLVTFWISAGFTPAMHMKPALHCVVLLALGEMEKLVTAVVLLGVLK